MVEKMFVLRSSLRRFSHSNFACLQGTGIGFGKPLARGWQGVGKGLARGWQGVGKYMARGWQALSKPSSLRRACLTLFKSCAGAVLLRSKCLPIPASVETLTISSPLSPGFSLSGSYVRAIRFCGKKADFLRNFGTCLEVINRCCSITCCQSVRKKVINN